MSPVMWGCDDCRQTSGAAGCWRHSGTGTITIPLQEPEPAVLLRDTPEDRGRLRGIVRDVMNKWLGDDLAPDDEWNAEYDAIIAALREAK